MYFQEEMKYFFFKHIILMSKNYGYAIYFQKKKIKSKKTINENNNNISLVLFHFLKATHGPS